MRILILGCKGQLGRCLYDQLRNTDHEVIQTSREEIDVGDLEETRNKILDIAPEVVINATAYTAVDKAEEDQLKADLINHKAVKNIAKVCNETPIWLIHFSTDYVFDGVSNVPYTERDQTNPQCVYGKTKLLGELAIRSSGCKHIIIRTAWVFSEYGNNFLTTMLKLGSDRDEAHIVSDQIGCPTYAQDLAKIIVIILPKLNPYLKSELFHYCGSQSCSWYEFAIEIFKQAKAKNFKVPDELHPIESSAYPTLAKRPIFSVLDYSKIGSQFMIKPSNWKLGIKEAISKKLLETK